MTDLHFREHCRAVVDICDGDGDGDGNGDRDGESDLMTLVDYS